MIAREGSIIILKHLVYKSIITIEQNHKANASYKNLATNSPYFLNSLLNNSVTF